MATIKQHIYGILRIVGSDTVLVIWTSYTAQQCPDGREGLSLEAMLSCNGISWSAGKVQNWRTSLTVVTVLLCPSIVLYFIGACTPYHEYRSADELGGGLEPLKVGSRRQSQ